MKISKVAVIAAITFSSFTAFNAGAQDKPQGDDKGQPKGPPAAGARAERVATELGLSADQKVKWDSMMKGQAEKLKAIHDDTNLTPDQKREKAKTVREETNKKIKEILTPEQQAKWQKMREEHQGRPGGVKPAPAPSTPAPAPAPPK